MMKIKFRGFTIHYNDPHDVAAIIESHVLDVYRIGNIHEGDAVIDIGAGIGEFSLLASKRTGKYGKVIAIEPSPNDYETLLCNLNENRCENVIPLNMGVSDKPEVLELKFKGRNFKCKADSLKNILTNSKIDQNPIEFMKMDIEGGERFVIPSSIDIVEKLSFLAMEIHNGYSSELIPLMRSKGFDFKRITKSKYILASLKTVMFHPFESEYLLKAFKRTGEYPGLRKMAKGIEISDSENLVVGIFTKSKRR